MENTTMKKKRQTATPESSQVVLLRGQSRISVEIPVLSALGCLRLQHSVALSDLRSHQHSRS